MVRQTVSVDAVTLEADGAMRSIALWSDGHSDDAFGSALAARLPTADQGDTTTLWDTFDAAQSGSRRSATNRPRRSWRTRAWRGVQPGLLRQRHGTGTALAKGPEFAQSPYCSHCASEAIWSPVRHLGLSTSRNTRSGASSDGDHHDLRNRNSSTGCWGDPIDYPYLAHSR